MKTNLFKNILMGGIAVLLIALCISTISVKNREVVLRNRFKQKETERKAFFQNMYSTLNQKSQIALKNDSSFAKNVALIMSGRKDSEGVMMKWITESNPNANFSEVSALYKDLSRAVEGKRDTFFNQEKSIQDVVREHDDLINKIPTNIILKYIFGVKPLEYKPISSEYTDNVFKNSQENDLKLF